MSEDKYKNRYRIPTNRLQGYDYGSNGCYYVTICTKTHIHYFGEIVDGEMQLSEIGKIAEKFWLDIPNHFPFVILDQFVIMPNHIHGVLFFNKIETAWHPNKFGPQSQNLGAVIRAFKSSLKRYANENNIDFAWQERFHDTIIRNQKALDNVRKYIINNPQNWENDKFNEQNV